MFWKRRHLLFVSQIKPVAFEKKFNPAHYFCSRAAQITLIMINVEEELRVLNKSKMRKTPKMRMEREREREKESGERGVRVREQKTWHDFFAKLEPNLLPKRGSLLHNGSKVRAIKSETQLCHPVLMEAKDFFCLITLLSKQMRKYDTGVLNDTELSWMTTSFRSWSPRWN